MELNYTTKDGRLTVKLTGSTQKELFRELHRFQEVFEDSASAKINNKYETSDDIRYIVRKSKYTDEKGKEKEAEYFEKRIFSGPLAGYQKSFGVLDDGTYGLFPKKAPDGNYEKGFGNWYKFIKGSEPGTGSTDKPY